MKKQIKEILNIENVCIKKLSIKEEQDNDKGIKLESENTNSGSFILVFIHLLCVALIFLGIYVSYKNYIIMDIAEVKQENVDFPMNKAYPSWFYVSEDAMYTSKPINEKDKEVLYNLVADDDSISSTFKININKLAYLSHKNFDYACLVYVLLGLISILGCLVRNMYDFIGHHCYTKRLDLKTWWPWYLLRPVIAVCLSVFLYIVSTGNVFEIDSLENTNNLLIISFFIGFAVHDVITLLRKTSKTVFANEENKKS